MLDEGPRNDRQSALGVHRVIDPVGVLPQAARRLDAAPAIGPDEVRIAVQRLNLDAASFRQLSESCGGDGAAVRAAVLDIVATRGKMQNPVTGSGGMLIGLVDAVGPEFTRAFYADPVRRYMLPVFSDRRTDWPSHPHATHMSCSWRLSRVAWGCEGQSVRRSENTGSM